MFPGGAFAAVAAKSGSGFSPLSPNTMSVVFPGTNQYVNVGSLSYAWDSANGAGFVWARPDSLASFQCVTGQGYANSSHIGIFVGITNLGAPYLYLGGVSVTGSNGTISAGNWYMFSWSFTGGVGKFYVNGVQIGSNITIGSETAGADWLIGCTRYNNGDNAGDSFPFTGVINNMALYSVSLSAGQMLALYNSGVPVSPTNIASCTHWWKFGDDANDYVSSSYTIKDAIGANDGTLTHYDGGGAPWRVAPGSSANTYAYLPTGVFSPEYQFRADDFTAATNWTATFGAYVADYSGGSGHIASVKQASAFSGVNEVTVGDILVMNSDTVHGLGAASVLTFAFVYYTGALDGSGGFFAGSDDDGTGKAHVRLFNYFYTKDIGARVYNNADTENELSGLNSVHANKYVMVHVVVDIPNALLKSYVNGTLINSMSISASTYNGQAVKFGIMSIGKEGVGVDYESTANGQAFIEFTRYNAVLTPKQIAAQAAAFNTIKGYK